MDNRQELVNFYGDKLTSVQTPDGNIFVVANDVLRAIGFDEEKVNNQRKAWSKDMVIIRGSKKIPLQFYTGIHETFCLNRKILPLALAKISITPTMQREQPEIVKKLIRYQEECSDVLYQHFFRLNNPFEAPISREEVIAYYMQLHNELLEQFDKIQESFAATEKKVDLLSHEQEAFRGKFRNILNEQHVSLVHPDWVKRAVQGIEKIKEYCPSKTQEDITKEIIQRFTDDKINIKEYCPTFYAEADSNTILSSISTSEFMMGMFQCYANDIYRKYINTMALDVFSSADISEKPKLDIVDEEIARIKEYGPYRYQRVYLKMDDISGGKLKAAYKKKASNRRTTKKSVIEQSPDLLDLMRQAVTAIIKEENCG